jgi:TolB-like protein
MAKDKDQRYKSTGVLNTELERIEQGLPTTDTPARARKPITSKEITVQLSLKKLLIPSIIFIAALVVILILWSPWKKKGPSPVPSDKPSLAVLYFDNNTRDENLEYLRKSLADLLTDDLIQSKHLRVLDGQSLYGILKDLDLLDSTTYSAEDLKNIADAARVNNLLVGNYARLGQIYILNVQIRDMFSGETKESLREEARSEEEIWPKIDSLTRKVKRHLGLSVATIAGDIDNEISRITSSSPDALKSYSQGRSFQRALDYKSAVIWLKKAVEADPQFAMAYRVLGVTAPQPERDGYLQKAFELRDRPTNTVKSRDIL